MHISGTHITNDTMWMIWYSDMKSYLRAETLLMLNPNQNNQRLKWKKQQHKKQKQNKKQPSYFQ